MSTTRTPDWREIADEKDAKIARLEEALKKISGMVEGSGINIELAQARNVAREALGWFDDQ